MLAVACINFNHPSVVVGWEHFLKWLKVGNPNVDHVLPKSNSHTAEPKGRSFRSSSRSEAELTSSGVHRCGLHASGVCASLRREEQARFKVQTAQTPWMFDFPLVPIQN